MGTVHVRTKLRVSILWQGIAVIAKLVILETTAKQVMTYDQNVLLLLSNYILFWFSDVIITISNDEVIDRSIGVRVRLIDRLEKTR